MDQSATPQFRDCHCRGSRVNSEASGNNSSPKYGWDTDLCCVMSPLECLGLVVAHMRKQEWILQVGEKKVWKKRDKDTVMVSC